MTRARARRPAGLYAIADAAALAPRRLSEGAAEMASAGVRTIQLRAKRLSDREFFAATEETLHALGGWAGDLWIDDRVDLAMALAVAGVHLGSDDLPARAAREILPRRVAIGQSTHDETQLAAADADASVDVVAFGPVFASTSKDRPGPPVGLERLARARQATPKPLVAIGGIDETNLGSVLATGVDAVAMISAVCRGDIAANCRRLLARIDEARFR